MMEIHFYDEWDKLKQSREKRNSYQLNWLNTLNFFQGSKGAFFLVVGAVSLAFAFSYLFFADHGQAMKQEQMIHVTPESISYTVEKGDTLWLIAGTYYPEMDRGQAVQIVRDANHLQGSIILEGQTLILP